MIRHRSRGIEAAAILAGFTLLLATAGCGGGSSSVATRLPSMNTGIAPLPEATPTPEPTPSPTPAPPTPGTETPKERTQITVICPIPVE
jgi:hypothetical protein